MSTLQKTFDKVVKHLRKQGCKSINDFNRCSYRGPGGLRCAAGVLIPNNKYRYSFEGCVADMDPVSIVFSNLGYDVDFVRKLQKIHDHYDLDEWEKKFEQLAKAYELTYTAPVKKGKHDKARNIRHRGKTFTAAKG